MNEIFDRRQPGHLPVCRDCQHRTPDPSHPSPCDLVCWRGPRHSAPRVSDGECEEFSPRASTLADARGPGIPPTPHQTAPADRGEIEVSRAVHGKPMASATGDGAEAFTTSILVSREHGLL